MTITIIVGVSLLAGYLIAYFNTDHFLNLRRIKLYTTIFGYGCGSFAVLSILHSVITNASWSQHLAQVLAVPFAMMLGVIWYINQLEDPEEEPPPSPQSPPPEPEPPAPPPPYMPDTDTLLEHAMILGGSGSGKTSLIATWIAHQITQPVSLIVFDSQGDLLNKILKTDFPRSRVVLIDPTDINYPVSLSLFDFKSRGETAYDKEKNFNTVVELLNFVLSSLDSVATAKQDLALRMVIRLCLVIPGATIHTLRELFTDQGFKKHAEHVAKLSQTAQAFFNTEYLSKQFAETREQLMRRVFSILESEPLERMFSNTETKLDMRKILDDGSIVLVNTARSFLKQDGSVFFTRFITALIFQTIQERDPAKDNTPTFLYIDEAAPVISEQTCSILEVGRKYKLGCVLAFQSLGQIDASFQHSVISNTALKAVSGVSAKDARAIADDMGTRPEYIMSVPRLTFKVHTKRGHSSLEKIEPGALDRLPKRTDFRQLIAENRLKYCVERTNMHRPPPDPEDDIESMNKA